MVLCKHILLSLLLLALVLSYLNIQKKSDISHSHDLSRRLSELTDFEADMSKHLRPDVGRRSFSLAEDFGDPKNVEIKAYHQNLLPKEKGLRLLMMGDSITK